MKAKVTIESVDTACGKFVNNNGTYLLLIDDEEVLSGITIEDFKDLKEGIEFIIKAENGDQ